MRYSDDPKASCWSSIQERQNQRNDANLRTWRQHIAYHQQPAAAQLLWQKKLSLNLKGKKKEKRRILLLLFPSTSTGTSQSSYPSPLSYTKQRLEIWQLTAADTQTRDTNTNTNKKCRRWGSGGRDEYIKQLQLPNCNRMLPSIKNVQTRSGNRTKWTLQMLCCILTSSEARILKPEGL